MKGHVHKTVYAQYFFIHEKYLNNKHDTHTSKTNRKSRLTLGSKLNSMNSKSTISILIERIFFQIDQISFDEF